MSTILPFIIIICASFFQGSFGLGMKYMKPLRWESWWIIHALTAMILFPMIWAIIAVPHLFQAIAAAPANVLFTAALFGFLWGIGGILYGVCVPFIGISLTSGVVMGLASSVGSLIPLFSIENATSLPSFPYIIAGVAVMLAGVAVTAWAGIKRDKDAGSASGNGSIGKGLLLAVICGVLSSLLNVGFSKAAPVAQIAEDMGATVQNSSLAAWVVVLIGAFLMNFLYTIYLFIRNKRWYEVDRKATDKPCKAYAWAVIAGIFWFAALGVYGLGASMMGEMGPVIGWPMLLGLSLIISNAWGFFSGEWKGANKAFGILIAGLCLIIAASGILGYANLA